MRNKNQKGHKQHKLRVTNWVGGILVTEEFIFDVLEDAIIESKKHGGRVKIYDFDNLLVRCDENDNIDTYA